MPLQEFKLKDVRPNPFRHLDRYPIRPDTVAALQQSIKQTGWWEGGARGRPTSDGKLELAAGHHRLAALLAEYGLEHKASFIVNPLSDEVMLQEMANENRDEYGSSVAHALTVVRSTVEGFAEDRYPGMNAPEALARGLRYAPSYQIDGPAAAAGRAYTAETVAAVLGWRGKTGHAKRSVQDALSALEMIEEGALDEAQYCALGTREAEATLTAARTAREHARIRAAAEKKRAADAAAAAKVAEEKATAARIKAEEAVKIATATKKKQAEEQAEIRRKLEAKRHEEAKKRQEEQKEQEQKQREEAAAAAAQAASDRIEFEKEDKAKIAAAQQQRFREKAVLRKMTGTGRARSDEEASEKLRQALKYWEPKHPKTAKGDAARKAEGLLHKAASVKDAEATAFLKKANQLISDHELFVYVLAERLR